MCAKGPLGLVQKSATAKTTTVMAQWTKRAWAGWDFAEAALCVQGLLRVVACGLVQTVSFRVLRDDRARPLWVKGYVSAIHAQV